IGVLPGVLGTIQATEAIKFLLGQGELLTGRLLTYNALRMKFREVPVRKNPNCPICGENPTITELRDELDAMNVCDLGTK
ncbi:MAG TPA: ThiF family adenylyltransferase, partial [Geobacteraceae bacterium]|nr:ThiF family adenylyltransferase [Geobacteraceae bacterium]